MAEDITSGLVWWLPGQDFAESTNVWAAVGATATLVNNGNAKAASIAGPTSGYPRALALNGTNGYVNGGNAAALTPAGAFTLAIRAQSNDWAKTYGTFISKSGGAVASLSYETRVFGTSKKPEFVISNAGALGSTQANTALTNGSHFYSLIFVYNLTDLRIYIDGVLDGTPRAKTGATVSTTEPISIGCRKINSTPDLFSAIAWADARLYSRALTADQAAALAAYRGSLTRRGQGIRATPGRR